MNFKMKSVLVAGVMGLLSLTAGQAFAVVYTVDTKIGSANLASSGDAVELAAMCSAAGFSAPPACPLSMDFKLDSGDAGFNFGSNGAGSWFIDVAPSAPGYFLLKFGIGGLPGVTHDTFFFQNIGELTKLVFTDAQVQFITGNCGVDKKGKPLDKCNIGRLSHYDGFSTSTIPVPAALPLLLTGLAGLGWLGRRRAKKA